MAIRDLLMSEGLSLTPSEEKIVQAAAGRVSDIGPGHRDPAGAGLAGVSDPTVVRLVMKLGYDGKFADFQARSCWPRWRRGCTRRC
jgi:DNA-binding MurR/RpiR family transcriptional regulator